MRIGEQLELAAGDVTCAYCEESLGSATENFKRNLAVEEGGIERAGPHYVDPSRFVDGEMVFRRFYCPGCGTMLFTETARKGDPILAEFSVMSEGDSR